MKSLKDKTVSAVGWSFADRLAQQGVQLIVLFLMMRMLEPAEFGIIGMLSFVMALAQTAVDSGFGQAIIQKQSCTALEKSSIFYLNISLAACAVLIIWCASPWIASFFGVPLLTEVARVLSFSLLFTSFGLIQTSVLTKALDFVAQARAGVLANIGSGLIGVSMAYFGYGVWSLAVQAVSAALFRSAALWLLSSWRPLIAFSWSAVAGLFRFGGALLAAGAIDTAFRNIYQPIVGKLFPVQELGFYSMATRVGGMPAENLTSIVGRVAFPAFAMISGDKMRLRFAVQRSASMMMAINVPFTVGLALVASPALSLLVGDKWSPAIPYLQLYCVVGLLLPLHHSNVNALLALGRSDLFFRLELVKKASILGSLVLVIPWGISGLLCGQIAVSLFAWYLNSMYIGKFLDYGLWLQFKDVSGYFLLGVVMALSMLFVRFFFSQPSPYGIVLELLAGWTLYWALALRSRESGILELITILKSSASRQATG
jgi:teichuronic acid exporter